MRCCVIAAAVEPCRCRRRRRKRRQKTCWKCQVNFLHSIVIHSSSCWAVIVSLVLQWQSKTEKIDKYFRKPSSLVGNISARNENRALIGWFGRRTNTAKAESIKCSDFYRKFPHTRYSHTIEREGKTNNDIRFVHTVRSSSVSIILCFIYVEFKKS